MLKIIYSMLALTTPSPRSGVSRMKRVDDSFHSMLGVSRMKGVDDFFQCCIRDSSRSTA